MFKTSILQLRNWDVQDGSWHIQENLRGALIASKLGVRQLRVFFGRGMVGDTRENVNDCPPWQAYNLHNEHFEPMLGKWQTKLKSMIKKTERA